MDTKNERQHERLDFFKIINLNISAIAAYNNFSELWGYFTATSKDWYI